MSEKIFNTRIQHKHDIEANWSKAINFIPKQGELIVYDKDQNHSQIRLKMGDGTTKVNDLPFSIDEILIGTTEEITPTQVAEATETGRNVSVTYNHAIYGVLVFSSFIRSNSFNAVASSAVLNYDDTQIVLALFGQLSTNQWFMPEPVALATKNDIPSALPNPESLTFKPGTNVLFSELFPIFYDGESARTVYLPTKTSHLENDSGFATEDKLPKAFYVTVWDNGDGTGTPDKTYEEILAAYEKGSAILGRIDTAGQTCVILNLMTYEQDIGVFVVTGIDADGRYWAAMVTKDEGTLVGYNLLVNTPVIGTTEDYKPLVVKYLMDAGRPFAITHTDNNYGSMLFNSFVYSQAVNNQILSSTVFQVANVTFCAQLFGNLNNNTWTFSAFELADKNDLPTAFYITVDPSTGTVDKTDSEIEAAYQAEKPIYCLYPAHEASIRCPLTTKFEIEGTDVWVFSIVGLWPLTSNATAGYIMVTNGYATIESNTLANSEDIPTVPESLKNPNKLIVTDGFLSRKEYDGSSEVTVTIPIVPSALKNPYALTINGTKYDGSEAKTISGLATETYVNNKVASMVDSAPEALNTLNELAAALGDDPNFATTIAGQIGSKIDKTDIDATLSDDSTNPVQNRVVKDALDQKPGKRNPDNSAETFNSTSNHAKGDYSHAEGWNTLAYGISAHAEGTGAIAKSDYSHAEGWNTLAIGKSAHAEGIETVAMGDCSHAEGHGRTYVTDHEIHISGEANTQQYQIMDEEINEKLSVYSVIKYNGVYAQVRKIENNIITLTNTLSSEPLENATAFIVTNYGAFGSNSHAEGYHTLAKGEMSHAEGINTLALSYSSHAEGASTIAASSYQHVQGRYNIEDSENKYAHIIGNGYAKPGVVRSNAHTVDWKGNAWFAGDVYVKSSSGYYQDEGSKKLATEDQVNGKVDKVSGKGLSTNDYTNTEKAKLDNTNIAYGTCSTAAATAEKVVVLNGNTQWSLKTGSIIMVKFDVSNTAENVKINVNNTGAYPIWYNNAEYTGTGTAYTGYANRTITYMFNGTHYVWITASYDANSTYTNAALGQGYATCSTAAATTAKVGSLSSYKLVTGGIVAVKFTNSVPANATLNINSTGAKSIYYKGAKITGDIIKAGEVATFVYSTYYHLISIDRCDQKALTINGIAYDGSAQKTIETEIFYINYDKTNNSFDKTLEQIEAAYQAKRQIVCVYPRIEPYISFVPLSLRGSAYEWEFSGWIDSETYINIQNKDGQITIFENTLSSKIEQIVDQKIASITNAEGVSF